MSQLVTGSSALEHFYLPFARVDEEKREVTAYCFTSPRVSGDKWNLKYNTLERSSKRYMQMPCIREMHQPSAAGNATRIEFDPETQRAVMTLEVVDDEAWKKVLKGVYRGLSIGGVPLITRGNDIEEFDWIETSLVDRPKDKGALFIDVRRVEDALAGAQSVALPEDASDDDVELARAELVDQLERLETGLELERYDASQPRDDHGMWTIVAGHRISVYGHAITHDHIHEAKTKFGLSDETHQALLKAHDAGHITTDHHLYRTLSHAEAKAGGLHALTTAHIESGIGHHASGGSHENRWHSEAHGQAPKVVSGMTMGHALGAHELALGDIVHFPSHGDKAPVAGVVHKVNPKTIDIASVVGGASVGVRLKKDELKRPGFVRRDKALHHIEVARFEEGTLERIEFDPERAQYLGEALNAALSRTQPVERAEALSQIVAEIETLERGGDHWRTQPRDDIGRWTENGRLSVDHVHHVMKHEGIDEDHHLEGVRKKIESGELKTREDVLKHIDAIHEERKQAKEKEKGEKKEEPKEGGDSKGKKTDSKSDGKKGEAKPDKTSKSAEKEPAHGTEEKPRTFKEHLKKFALDAFHNFMHHYRLGYAATTNAVGRAEEGENHDEEVQALIGQFFDGLENADFAHIKGALQAAIAALGAQAPVARAMESGDVPTREHLEGPKEGLMALRQILGGSTFGADQAEELREILLAAFDTHQLQRGEGVESLATDFVPLQRFEEVSSELSIARGEVQAANEQREAAVNRAELAEGNVTRLESENELLRALPNRSRVMASGVVPVPRDYPANDVLQRAEESLNDQRQKLEKRKRDLLAEVPTADSIRRGDIAGEVAGIDAMLARLL